MTTRPKSTFQIEFLEKIQRILSEGSFTATYKFALLHALADLCIETTLASSGDALTLPTRSIADRFIGLYYRQARVFPGGGAVLKQNTKGQAVVVSELAEPARDYRVGKLPTDLPSQSRAKILCTIRRDPIPRLERLGAEEPMSFLYETPTGYTAKEITLRPGIAYCFRAFHPFIVSMVRDRWERWIRRHNAPTLGEAVDLHEFLFGSERQNLAPFRDALLEVGGARCFYSGNILKMKVVDHFVPWSRYPTDLGHNFVLASPKANQQKKDLLPGVRFLDRWLELCVTQGARLTRALESRGLRHDLHASLSIVEWSYGAVERSGGRVWQGGKETALLDPGWRDLVHQTRRQLA